MVCTIFFLIFHIIQKIKHLFIWLQQVFVVARGILVASRRLFDCVSWTLSCGSNVLCTVLSRSVMSHSLRPHGLQPTRLLYLWGFSRQEYWSELPRPPPRDLLNPGIEPRSPALQADSLPAETQVKPKNTGVGSLSLLQGNFPRELLRAWRVSRARMCLGKQLTSLQHPSPQQHAGQGYLQLIDTRHERRRYTLRQHRKVI